MIRKFEEYLIYFTVYSVMGWLYEVILETFIYGWGFSNRGVLFGPYCPVYGVGALLFIITVNRFIAKKPKIERFKLIPVVFILCMITATFVELAAAYILEYFTGSWPWQTYAGYAINFQARIALSPSIRFGIGGIIILYIIQPYLEKRLLHLRDNALNIIVIIISIVFIADIVCKFVIM
ncbi:MAG: putative ABC transporter permease [Clostridia bacterium]|nr:putative ABC transporter permease [Clostridia bacterium]